MTPAWTMASAPASALTPARRIARGALALALGAALAGCGGANSGGGGGLNIFGPSKSQQARQRVDQPQESTVWDLFGNRQNPNSTTAVNKYLWNASLEVLNFLPIQSVDPFTGVIVTGYGTPPGGGRSYRATIKIADPALDARSLKLALQGAGGGAVAPDTARAVEDAILTRARQLRIRDGQY